MNDGRQGKTNNLFAELIAEQPCLRELCPKQAEDYWGTVHQNTVPARRLLEQEGAFATKNYVDIFDGGPSLEPSPGTFALFRDSRFYALLILGQPKGIGRRKLLPRFQPQKVADFRCILIQRSIPPGSAMTFGLKEEAD